MYEGLVFLKRLSEAEGRPTPEIDALLSDDVRQKARLIQMHDPLERMGRRYARLSDAYLRSHPDFPFTMRPRPSGPTPFEVFAWFHQLVPAKLYRALVSAAHAARGDQDRAIDALVSAKVALTGIDRSLTALSAMAQEDDDPRFEEMEIHLRRLRREATARFPDAMSVVREGLDALCSRRVS